MLDVIKSYAPYQVEKGARPSWSTEEVVVVARTRFYVTVQSVARKRSRPYKIKKTDLRVVNATAIERHEARRVEKIKALRHEFAEQYAKHLKAPIREAKAILAKSDSVYNFTLDESKIKSLVFKYEHHNNGPLWAVMKRGASVPVFYATDIDSSTSDTPWPSSWVSLTVAKTFARRFGVNLIES